MKLLPDYFIESFESYGKDLALFCNNQNYTYDQLKSLVGSYQKEFRERGFEKENFVGVITGQDINTYAAIIAMVLSGIPYIPVNRKNPFDRFSEILEESGISKLVYSRLPNNLKSRSNLFSKDRIDLISLDDIPIDQNAPLISNEIDPEDYAYMLFTSGSTGKPKSVLVRHSNLAHFIALYFNPVYYDLGCKDRFLQMFDWTFDLAGMMTFIPLSIGASCFVVPEEGIKYYNILSILLEKKITVSMLVPSTLLYIKPYFKELRLPNLRYSMFCGEALLHDLMVKWSNCVSSETIIQNVYGPSECPGASSIFNWDLEQSAAQSVNGVAPIGKPVPGMEFYIIDDNKNILPPHETGTIALSSPQVTDSYWNDPERTAESYFTLSNGKHVYDTGDIGYQNSEGNFIFLGRKDHQMKLDGYRVEPGEVEYVVRCFLGSGIKVAFVASKNEKGILVPHLFIENLSVEPKVLHEYLESKLPPYMIPHKIHNIKNFPKNFNGKTDRRSLQELLSELTA